MRLKEIRNDNNLTIKQLSKLLNISTKTLSKYEKTGTSIRVNTLFNLCVLFNVRLDYILGLSDIKTPIKPYNKK